MMIAYLLAWAGVTLTLPTECRVRGTEIRVGDVAMVTGTDAAEIERVRAASLGYAPAPGYSRLLQAAIIQSELAGKLPGVSLSFAGSPACRVTPEIERVSGSAIEAAARMELERALPTRDAKLARVGGVSDVEVPASASGVELRCVLPSKDLRTGQVSAPVRLLIDGAPYRTVWTQWNLELFATRPVLLRDARAGETLEARDVEFRSLELPRNESTAVPALRDILSSSLSRDLRAGEPLEFADLSRPSLVQKGALLFLEIRSGQVTASAVARAEESGALGDRVRITVLESKREMTALVAARDLVRIDLPARR
jgi:flagella basal body P-ring formation protein FlgA